MKINKFLFGFFIIISNWVCLGQNNTPINVALEQSKNNSSIKSDSLKQFVKNFKTISYPFEFSEPIDEKIIDTLLLKQFLELEVTQEDLGYGNYYYGYVFYAPNFFGLILTHHYVPGAFGVNNYIMELFTINYEGKVIDIKEIGCYCNDSNMGSNEYYSTEPTFIIDLNKIILNQKNIHASLVEEDSDSSFENITFEKSEFNISPLGELIEAERKVYSELDGISEKPDSIDPNNAIYFIVIADTNLDYSILYDKMFSLSKKLNLSIDTMGRYFNNEKNLIALPDDDEDEVYAGDYFPRRFPSENLSLEYLNYYQNQTREKTIALVAGIYEKEENADKSLADIKLIEKNSYKLKAEVYIGCIH